jgi:D-arabinose 1-dehydrogenase-like Zn-dependent alcohol dehydrogenase
VVEALGEGVSGFAVGARVGLTPLATSCGACERCELGLERYCAKATLHGFHADGALATHGNVAAQHLVPLPEGPAQALAPLVGTGWSALGACRSGGVGVGQRVVVLGVGGLGHLALQLARHLGAEVSAVELAPERRAHAAALGAVQSVAPADAQKALQPAHVALVCTPSAQAIALAVRLVQRGGTVVLAGTSPNGRFDLALADVALRGVALHGSFLGARADLLEVLALHAAGKLEATTRALRLDEAPHALYTLRDLGFLGRTVVDCTTTGD